MVKKEGLEFDDVHTTMGEIIAPRREKGLPSDCPDLPFIGLEHIEAHTMRLLGTVPASSMRSNANRFYSGDVLYGRLRPYLNKIFMPSFGGYCSAEFIVFPNTAGIDSSFLKYRLNAKDFLSFATHINTGDRPRVDFKQLSTFTFLFPSYPEQHRIVAKIEELFSELDKGVEALKTAQQQLKVYRQAVLKWAFEGKLTEEWRKQQRNLPTADQLLSQIKIEREKQAKAAGKKLKPTLLLTETELAELPVLPKEWHWVRLLDIADKITDGEHITPRRESKGYLLLSARNIQNGSISLDNVDYIPPDEYERIIRRCNPQKDDILISCSGSVGRVCRVPAKLQFTMVRSVALVKIQMNKYLSKYLEYSLQSPILQKQIDRKKKATAQANIFIGPIGELIVNLPSAKEEIHLMVQEIESRLSVADKLEETINQSLQQAEALRQSILKKAFEGKLVPQDPNDEPAEKLLERIKAERAKEIPEKKTRKKKAIS